MRGVGDPAIGVRYHVEFTDCCIEGGFTAVLIDRHSEVEDGEEYGDTLVFDNGVTLSTWGQVELTEATDA